jgi:hypothetical protein
MGGYCILMNTFELLTAIKRYRVAYFAYHTMEMQINRDYQRFLRSENVNDAAWEVWDARVEGLFDARTSLRREMQDAEFALVEKPPAEYAALVAEMVEEFGD